MKLIHFDCVVAIQYYQSILPIIKNKKHLQNIGRMYTKKAVERHCHFETFNRKFTKQP